MIASQRIDIYVPFIEKDQAKRRGARWDGQTWYIPAGLQLEPFSQWLSAGVCDVCEPDHDYQIRQSSLALSDYLNQVQSAVAAGVLPGQWVNAEIAEYRQRNGHIYLLLIEHDSQGQMVAKTRAMIWRSSAAWIIKKFSQGTGGELGCDIKVLFRVNAEFHGLHGFTLVVNDVDPAFTLGDLAAKIAAIRQSLIEKSLYARNRQLPAPKDFTRVAVLAPPHAAGLGDFKREAEVLERHGLCRFDYYHAVFQGSGCTAQMQHALENIHNDHPRRAFDAVVIIRGGGPVTDLAWLNDEAIATAVCLMPVPVFTGIGHERDNTLLDEVACVRYDTPSKVGQAIFNTIKDNALNARYHFETITKIAKQMSLSVRRHSVDYLRLLRSKTLAQWEAAATRLQYHHETVFHQARLEMNRGSLALGTSGSVYRQHSRWVVDYSLQSARTDWLAVVRESRRRVFNAKLASRRFIVQWRQDQLYMLQRRRQQCLKFRTMMADYAGLRHKRCLQQVEPNRQRVCDLAAIVWRQGSNGARQKMRQVLSLGLDQTMQRGFTLVRDDDDRLISRARQVKRGQILKVFFYDGSVQVKDVSDE